MNNKDFFTDNQGVWCYYDPETYSRERPDLINLHLFKIQMAYSSIIDLLNVENIDLSEFNIARMQILSDFADEKIDLAQIVDFVFDWEDKLKKRLREFNQEDEENGKKLT
ncbi:MAG: hypothetical protein ACFFDN_00800 [Candidatus Hodarchaeota archaeon]